MNLTPLQRDQHHEAALFNDSRRVLDEGTALRALANVVTEREHEFTELVLYQFGNSRSRTVQRRTYDRGVLVDTTNLNQN